MQPISQTTFDQNRELLVCYSSHVNWKFFIQAMTWIMNHSRNKLFWTIQKLNLFAIHVPIILHMQMMQSAVEI